MLSNPEEDYPGWKPEDNAIDDRIILISDGFSEAGVTPNELEYITETKQLWGIVYTYTSNNYRTQCFQNIYPTKEEAEEKMYQDLMENYFGSISLDDLKTKIKDEKVVLIDEWVEIIWSKQS